MNDVVMNEAKVFDACALVEGIIELSDAGKIREMAQAAAALLNEALVKGEKR